jgi:hypothetical protein
MNKRNVKTILSTKYQLFYTFKDSSIKREIKLDDYWLSDTEKKDVYKVAYRENLKQMREVNSYNISKNKQALYSSLMLIKTELVIQDNKINKDIKILENTLLKDLKEMKQIV